MLINLQTANTPSENSWLNEPTYEEFMRGFNYATTQTRAISALSKCSPEEIYFVWASINRGIEFPKI